jgi:hypothetical protein
MREDEFRQEILAYREDAQRSADQRRDTFIVLERLERLYSSFDAGERSQANRVLAEWILADDQGLRFDARHLVRKFYIVELVEPLTSSVNKLAASGLPGAPEEAETVSAIIRELQDSKVVILEPAASYAMSVNVVERVS